MNLNKEQILDQGNCDFARNRGKAAYIKDVSPRTGTWYKADGMGELAPHSEALGSVPEVNHGVVHRFRAKRQDRARREPDHSAFLPGEASPRRFGGFKSTRTTEAAAAAMWRAGRDEESAESGVVVSEPVSNRRRVTRPVKSAASWCGRRLEPKKRKQPEVSFE